MSDVLRMAHIIHHNTVTAALAAIFSTHTQVATAQLRTRIELYAVGCR